MVAEIPALEFKLDMNALPSLRADLTLWPRSQGIPIERRVSRTIAKWQLPDGFVFLDAIPRTRVGKFKKIALPEQFANWKWEIAKLLLPPCFAACVRCVGLAELLY